MTPGSDQGAAASLPTKALPGRPNKIGHMKSYLEPTQAAGRALMQRGLRGPVVMLNLLRFRATADYFGVSGHCPGRTNQRSASLRTLYGAHDAVS